MGYYKYVTQTYKAIKNRINEPENIELKTL